MVLLFSVSAAPPCGRAGARQNDALISSLGVAKGTQSQQRPWSVQRHVGSSLAVQGPFGAGSQAGCRRGQAVVRFVVSTEAEATKGKKKSRRRAELHTEGDTLEDTPTHVLICLAAAALVAAIFGAAIGHVLARDGGAMAWVSVGLAALAAYAFADFATGVYHWGVDNYGDKNTPVFGYQIDAFQGHHTSPWTITERGVFNNVHKACVPALPLLALLALGNAIIPPQVSVFFGTFFASVIMSQEIHKWAHMVQPPSWVAALQEARVLLSRKTHGLHHNSPFEGNYCIVNGWCNGFLDKIGFFRQMEQFFFKFNGAVPNTWRLDESLRYEKTQ